MIAGLTGLVFAGGEGKRFAPFVTNKVLVPIAGKPLVQRVVESLINAGLQELVVVTNPQTEVFIKSLSYPNVTITTVLQPQAKGQGDALSLAAPLIGTRPSLVVNATCYAEDRFYQQVVSRTDAGKPFIAAMEREEYFPGGYVVEENGRAVSIVEKPEPNARPSRLVNLVFHFFPNLQEIAELVKATQTVRDDHYEQGLARYMVEREVGIEKYSGTWHSMKTPLSVLEISEAVLSDMKDVKVHPNAKVDPSARFIGPVEVADGAQVMAHATVVGPAYIGVGVLVGQGVLIRNSVVEEHVQAGYGTEICRSYVGPGCKLHHAYAGDSILEKDVRMAQGSCTANLRFDKQPVFLNAGIEKIPSHRMKLGLVAAAGVEFGVLSCSMPGTCAGAGTVIYPQAQARGFLPAGAHVEGVLHGSLQESGTVIKE